MAGKKDPEWHTRALKLRAEGFPLAEIAQMVDHSPATVAVFLSRAKKDPEESARKLLKSPLAVATPVTLSPERTEQISDLIVKVERHKVAVWDMSLSVIEDFQALTVVSRDDETYKIQKDKVLVAIETIKALRGPSNVAVQVNDNRIQQTTKILVEAVRAGNNPAKSPVSP